MCLRDRGGFELIISTAFIKFSVSTWFSDRENHSYISNGIWLGSYLKASPIVKGANTKKRLSIKNTEGWS